MRFSPIYLMVMEASMSYAEIEHLLGPSAVMGGADIDLEQAIHAAQERLPGRSFCVVDGPSGLARLSADLALAPSCHSQRVV
jgi:hypothetical protein